MLLSPHIHLISMSITINHKNKELKMVFLEYRLQKSYCIYRYIRNKKCMACTTFSSSWKNHFVIPIRQRPLLQYTIIISQAFIFALHLFFRESLRPELCVDGMEVIQNLGLISAVLLKRWSSKSSYGPNPFAPHHLSTIKMLQKKQNMS